jgi:hypothetical protein
MYPNPFSISCVASLTSFAVLQWYSSFGIASSSWVYRSVVLRSLCPKSAFTVVGLWLCSIPLLL